MQPDARIRESLRFGFEREGVAVTTVAATEELDPAPFAEPAEVVIAGGRSVEEASAVLAKVRGALVWCGREAPILYVGNGIGRPQALGEGATEFLGQPAFVRDAVTVARLIASRKRENPAVLVGDLAQHFGFYYLVRALSAVKRTGVLTMVRGLRRGELRFFEGEVTSAQAGLLHGLAAFHQLLLWTEARFELRPEEVVRRRQIPLEPNELFADAERFLAETIAVAGQLAPAAIYERDEQQIARVAGAIPEQVDAVLRLFDGQRTVADVVEDCAFRIFETLRLANRMCELGLIRLREAPRTRHSAHAALAIDEWLVGSPREQQQPPKPAPRHVVIRKSDPVGPPPGRPASPPGSLAREEGGRRKKRRRGTPSAEAPIATVSAAASTSEPLVVDWVGLLPQSVTGGSDGGVSQVVPSSVAAGEIGFAPAYPGQVTGDLRARREQEAPPVPAPVRERIEDVAPAAELVQHFAADAPPAVAQAETSPASPPPRVVVAPDSQGAVDQGSTTERLDKVDTSEVSGTIELDIPPQKAAGVIVSKPMAPSEEAQAVPSIVIDQPSAHEVAAPVALFDPPPVTRPAVPPVSEEEHAIAVARKALADRSSGKRTHGRKPTPVPHAPAPQGRRKQTRPPVTISSFSDAEEAFFAQGSKLAEAGEPDVESFDDLDEGMDLPNTFWKRLFRSSAAQAKRPTPPLKHNAPRRPATQPGRTSTPPPRRPGGSRKK